MDDYFSYSDDELKYEYLNDSRSETEELLGERSEDIIALSSPYTVLMKIKTRGKYLFIAYSLGRPRNVVWGYVDTDINKSVNITFGCKWNDMKTINKMLEIRESRGFSIVSTYAKDRITNRLVANLLEESYKKGTSFQYGKYFMKKEDIIASINGFLLEEYSLREASVQVANNLLDKGNIGQYLKRGDIPIYVINKIHEFLEHNPTLSSGELPIECPLYEDCILTNDIACDMFGTDFDIL